MAKKKKRALDLIRDMPYMPRGSIAWYRVCESQDEADQLNEVRVAYQAGELSHTRTQIAKKLRGIFSMPCSNATITRFLDGEQEATCR